ncbi:MAG TPA: branched-chain amino acid ABC transporter permease [Microbacteriaceae bacterium]|nr:branched-chain amino acid ABC transporter permease [Microbacteriaceae bacterium]
MKGYDAVVSNRWVRLGTFLALVVVLAIVPLVADPFTNQTISHIAVFAVAILGLNIVMGFTGLVSLGHSFFVGVGAYCAIIPIRDWWGGPLAEGAIVIGFLLSGLIPGVLGLLIALVTVRLRGLALAMVTIALPTIGLPLAQKFSEFTGGNEGVSIRRLDYVGADGEIHKGNPFAAGPGLENDQWQYYIVVTIAIAFFALAYFLVRGKYGRAFAIVKSNEAIASSMGVSPYRYKVLAFTIAAIYGGIAGFLLIVWGQFTSSETLAFHNSIDLVIASIVGGAGSIVGAVLGGIFYVAVSQIMNGLQLSIYTTLVQGVVIIVILFLLPGGLASLPRTIRRLVRRGRSGHSVGADPTAGSTTENTK